MTFGAYNWLGLLFWVLISVTAVIASWLIIKDRKKWHKKTENLNGMMSGTAYFIAWLIIWALNAPAVYIFWSFPIHHVEVNGINLTQDHAPGINYGLYNSALIFYFITYIIFLVWTLLYWTQYFVTDLNKSHFGVFLAMLLWIVSAVTLALFYSICSCSGVSKSTCWVPGLLFTPHFFLVLYTIYMSIQVCWYFSE